eukprot:TRINITY_DN4982_c0_g1_i1.p1 TRINITY_DN4982_c0_g1~~TRINITY_DN4982_c0_g1_i1.p1  ORF type:complete len:592 (-),score=152.62 TRINITY_DN4982_c0_g1_i1:23-1798(-)
MVHAVEPKDDCPHLQNSFSPNKLPTDLKPKMPCIECQSTVENWICLNCYQIGCSRYHASHSSQHFENKFTEENDANHCVAASFSDCSVWCYQCNSYITHPSLKETLRSIYDSKGINDEEESELFANTRSPDHIYFPWNDVKWVMESYPLISSPISSIEQLERVIEKFSGMEKGRVSFFGRYFSEKSTPIIGKDEFISRLLPVIQKLVVESSDVFSTISNREQDYKDGWTELFPFGPTAIVKEQIPLLPNGIQANVVMNRIQVACLLANLFFNTFASVQYLPKTKTQYPEYNLDVIYTGFNQGAKAKMDCILQYFLRFAEEPPSGSVVFSRVVVKKQNVPNWENSTKPLKNVVVDDLGTIEDSASLGHTDFANKSLGGGVLFGGNVQEEILFVIKPECLVGLLFCSEMEEHEAIIITGAEQFSKYTGYGGTFRYNGEFREKEDAPRLFDGSLARQILAYDALIMSGQKWLNFELGKIKRELRKAYAAFQTVYRYPNTSVATGNWGCGMFGGDKHVKFLLQILAASESQKDVHYYTFKDSNLKMDAELFLEKASSKGFNSVGSVFKLLVNNAKEFVEESDSPNILHFLCTKME